MHYFYEPHTNPAIHRNSVYHRNSDIYEDGVGEDMDGYMNYLSLEYDSVWDTKPSR